MQLYEETKLISCEKTDKILTYLGKKPLKQNKTYLNPHKRYIQSKDLTFFLN